VIKKRYKKRGKKWDSETPLLPKDNQANRSIEVYRKKRRKKGEKNVFF